MYNYVFIKILQETFFRENCARENSEGNLNISIKMEEVCIDEHFSHCFCYLLLITNF